MLRLAARTRSYPELSPNASNPSTANSVLLSVRLVSMRRGEDNGANSGHDARAGRAVSDTAENQAQNRPRLFALAAEPGLPGGASAARETRHSSEGAHGGSRASP